MRIIRLSATVLAIAGLMGTSAAPTSEAMSDNTGGPMPTEIHRARDDTYLDATRTRPLEGGRLNARLAQNVGPDEMALPTAARAIETLDAAEVPTGSGSKWAVVMVQNMQVSSAGNTTAVTETKSCTRKHVVMGITVWALGRESGWVVGVMVAIALIAVLLCCCTSLWCLRRMRESFENAVERVQKGHAGVSSPSQWTAVPVKPGEMWTMPLSPLPRAASDDGGYSPVHRSGTIHACPWHNQRDVHM